MPLYTFELRDGSRRIQDPIGVQLHDHFAAYDYACEVVRELMSGREGETRTWRLDVYEGTAARAFAIPFASVDPTLDHLLPELRATVERWCERSRSLQEAVSAARVTVRESRALVARSRGKPYLAAEYGETTIRGR